MLPLDTLRKIATTIALASVPIALWAFSSGPVTQRAGVPGEGDCTLCHRGASLNPDSLGRVTIQAQNYTPGQKQTIRVRVEHSTATRWGFQLTARVPRGDDFTQQAGAFTPNPTVRVRCGPTPGTDYPCNGALEFVEHTLESTRPGTTGGAEWEFEWTPPAANVGPIVFYATGNAANNSNSNAGDFIYSTNVTITSNAPPPSKPVFTQAGVVDAFNQQSGIASGSWMSIYGLNVGVQSINWDNAIRAGVLPVELDGVGVKVNNKPAAISFVGPSQVDFLAPNDDAEGPVEIVITSRLAGDSDPIRINKTRFLPAFYAPYSQANRMYVTALSATNEYVGKRGLDPRVTRSVRPGEVIQLYGSGFGPAEGVTQPPTDRTFNDAFRLANPVRILVNQTPAEVGYSGIVGPGLYLFQVTVPSDLENGEYALTAEVGGVRSSSNVYIAVDRP